MLKLILESCRRAAPWRGRSRGRRWLRQRPGSFPRIPSAVSASPGYSACRSAVARVSGVAIEQIIRLRRDQPECSSSGRRRSARRRAERGPGSSPGHLRPAAPPAPGFTCCAGDRACHMRSRAPSATTTMLCRRPAARPAASTSHIDASQSSVSGGLSGKNTQSAPPARLLIRARYPQFRPITSTTNVRWWLAAVLPIWSSASVIRCSAVSAPMVISVPEKSLSIEPTKPAIAR